MQSDPKIFYRRRLPHYQPPNETFHVTFRLAGSLSQETILRLKEARSDSQKEVESVENAVERNRLRKGWHAKYFDWIEDALDMAAGGPKWLQDPTIADLVAAAIHFRDTKVYNLLTFCIMPNHVHLLTSVERSDASLYRILQSLKSYTAREANALIGRSGAFWQHESYDHVIRDEAELERTIWYILNNPVKAGLCSHWRDWKRTYVKEGLVEP
jgi:REP element-mobilizing transposase RayT